LGNPPAGFGPFAFPEEAAEELELLPSKASVMRDKVELPEDVFPAGLDAHELPPGTRSRP
jgi:hypothetical protein